jgi:hypothetical protein
MALRAVVANCQEDDMAGVAFSLCWRHEALARLRSSIPNSETPRSRTCEDCDGRGDVRLVVRFPYPSRCSFGLTGAAAVILSPRPEASPSS